MKRFATIPIAALFAIVVLTGCATGAGQSLQTLPVTHGSSEVIGPNGERTSTPPSIGPQASGAESETQIDTAPVTAQAESGLVALATAHLKRASELAANGGDPHGKQCWDTSLSLLSMLSIGLGHEEGIAPVIEKGRLLAKTLKGPMVEQWEVDCAPVYVGARLDVLEFARRVFGDVIAAKVGLPIVGAVKGMLP